MNNLKKYYLALFLAWLVTLSPSTYYLHMQAQENNIIDQYLLSHNLNGLPISKESAVRISDEIRKDFNTKEISFVALDLANRPFLREDTGFLLNHREGVCGEGTRVIITLLHRLGFDATRITLYDGKLQDAHTLVSVIIDKQEFLVDSINSSLETNELLKKYNVSSNDFAITHYDDNIYNRNHSAKSDLRGKPEGFKQFFKDYLVYSYEANPYTKLLKKIGFDVRVFNLSRPNRWVSFMAEEPNMIMFCVTLFVSFIITYFLHKSGLIRKILQMTSA